MKTIEYICNHENYDPIRLKKFCKKYNVRLKGQKVDEVALEREILEHEDSALLLPAGYVMAKRSRVVIETDWRYGYENF